MIAYVFQKHPENFAFRLFTILQYCNFPVKFDSLLYFSFTYLAVSIVFAVYKQNLRLNNLRTRRAINAKVSVFVICVKAMIYLLFYDFIDFTLN